MSAAPIVTASGTSFVLVNGWVRLSDLIRVSNPDGGTLLNYQITDGNGASTSARGWYSGLYGPQGAQYTISSAVALSDIWIQGGTLPGVDTITIYAQDTDGYSNPLVINLATRASNAAPILTSLGTTGAPIGQAVAAASLITVTDTDLDAPVTYRFYDAAGGGYFTLGGVTQAAGQNIDVSAANIANLSYVGGSAKGSETLWAQVYDGGAWSAWYSWSQNTVRLTNTAPVISAASKNVGQSAWLRASELGISFSDADSDAPVTYRITDGNGAASSARFWVQGGGYSSVTGVPVTLTADQWANFWVQGGTDVSTDLITVQVFDGMEWSNTVSFNLNTRLPNRAPVATPTQDGVKTGQSIAASSMLNVTDADSDPVVAYRFWDSAGGGYFSLNGSIKAAGQNIDVSAAQLGGLAYFGGATKGSETLYAQVYDGQDWSAWTSWTQVVTRATNALSQITAGDKNVSLSQWIRATELNISITDADGDLPTRYRLIDNTTGASSARLWYNGAYVDQNQAALVGADQWANVWIQGGSNVGTDQFLFQIFDGNEWAPFTTFNLNTRAPNRAPVVAGAGTGVAIGQSAAATSLINVTDADADSPTIYRFYDAAGGGYFSLNGATQAAGQNIDVTAANIGTLNYIGGAAKGSETLWAQVYDGQAWSAWASWTQNTVRTTNTLPVISAANKATSQSAWLRGSELGINLTDADGDTPVTYEITDANSGASSARFWLAGNYQQGGTMTLTADQWAGFYMQGGTDTATDALTVRVNDGYGWSNTISFNLTTRLPNRAPVVSGASPAVNVPTGQSVAASTLISVTDADADSPTIYRFYDAAGGGYFSLNGATQAAGQNIDVTAANIGTLNYIGGAAKGSETLWAQVYDGQAWSAWASWSQATVRLTNVVPVISGGSAQLGAQAWLQAKNIPLSFSDADGDTPVTYEITDNNAGASSARLWLPSGYQAQTTLTLTQAQWDSMYIQGGSLRSTDTFTVRVNDGMGWSNSTTFSVATLYNRAPTVTASNRIVHLGETVQVTDLFTYSDADGDASVTYRIYDNSSGAGSFYGYGSPQSVRSNIDINAAQIGSYTYQMGSATSLIGSGELLYVQVYDGQVWSDWASFTVSAYVALPTNTYDGTAANNALATGLPDTIYYGGLGNDTFTATGINSSILVGGAGSDSYYVAPGQAVTVIYDSDSGGGNTLSMPQFLNGTTGSVGVIDGRHLVLAESTGRTVIVIDWRGANNNIDGFTNGVVSWNRAEIIANFNLALANQFPGVTVRGYTWESLGFSTAEVNAKILEVAQHNKVLQALQGRPDYIAGFAPYAVLPTAYKVEALDAGGATVAYSTTDHNRTAYIGRGGADVFNLGGGLDSIQVGNGGGDSYTAGASGRTIIMDVGNSTGDSLVISAAADFANNTLLVDGRHLLIKNTGGGATLLLDWRAAANRIETISIGGNAYSFDQFAALIDTQIAAANVLPVTWEMLGASTTQWNALMAQYAAVVGYANADLHPTVSAGSASVHKNDVVNLSTLLSSADPGGPGILQYEITDASGSGKIMRGGNVVTPGAGGTLIIAPADLSLYTVVPTVSGQSLSFSVRVTDGYATSAAATVTVAAVTNATPVITSSHPVVYPGNTVSLASLLSAGDADGVITQYELSSLTGGAILRRNGGAPIALGSPLLIAAGELSQYTLTTPGTPSADYGISVAGYDGYDWGVATAVTATTRSNVAPVVSPGSGNTVHGVERIALGALFGVSDGDADPATSYQVQAIAGARIWKDGVVQGAGLLTIAAADLASYKVSIDGSGAPIALTVRAYDGFAWSDTASVTADLAIGAPQYLDFGPRGTPLNLGTVGTVASSVLIPSSESVRLTDIVRINPALVGQVTNIEFAGVSANASFAYLAASNFTRLTNGDVLDYFTNTGNLDGLYLHSGSGTAVWQVRAQTAAGWSDWTQFSIVTASGNTEMAQVMPPDFDANGTPTPGRQITVDATSRSYDDWTGYGDGDIYRFSVTSGSTLRIEFSGLSGEISAALVNTNLGTYAGSSAIIGGNEIFNQGGSFHFTTAGGVLFYNLAPGDYALNIQSYGPGNTPYRLSTTYSDFNTQLAQLIPFAQTYGSFAGSPNILSRSNDNLVIPLGNNSGLYIGRQGNDTFSKLLNNSDPVNVAPYHITVMGGAGADTYDTNGPGSMVILEDGNSAGDVIKISGLQQAVIVEGRHLLLTYMVQTQYGNFRNTTLLLDWQKPENRIETFDFGGGETYTYQQVADMVASYNLPQLTWEQLGGPSSSADPIINGLHELEAAAENTPPVVTPASVTLHGLDKVALSSLFTVSDIDGNAITQYEFNTAGVAFWKDGVAQINPYIVINAADLGQYQVSVAAPGMGPVVYVRAHDGYAWSDTAGMVAPTVDSHSAQADAAPVIAATGYVFNGNNAAPLSALFSASDADGDAVSWYQITAVSGAQIWKGGVLQNLATPLNIYDPALLSQYSVAPDGSSSPVTMTVRGADGLEWGAPANITAPVAAAGPGPLQFGAQGSFSVLAGVAQVASTVLIPQQQSIRLDDIVRVGAGGGVTNYEFRSTNASTPGAYLVSYTLGYIPETPPVDFVLASLDGTYLHARNYSFADEAWQVRVQTQAGWSDWANFTVVTQSLSTLPADLASDWPGRSITIDTTAHYFRDWVGYNDTDIYRFTVTSGSSVQLTFAELDDPVIVYMGYGNSGPIKYGNIQSFSATGTMQVPYDGPGKPVAIGRDGGTITFHLEAGDYGFSVSSYTAGNTPYLVSIVRSDINILLDQLAPGAVSPAGYTARALTRTNDTITGSGWTNNSVYVGRQGDDQFTVNYVRGASAVLMGGVGDDLYEADGSGNLVILEDGNSSGDTVRLTVTDLAHHAAIIDGRHLLIRNSTNVNQTAQGTTLLVDWQKPENRAETFVLNGTTYTYAEFADLITSYGLQQISWADLGSSSSTWDQAIANWQALNSAITNNAAPVLTSSGAVLHGVDRVALSSLFNYADPENNPASLYEVKVLSGAVIWRFGIPQFSWADASGILHISAADLAQYQVSADASTQPLQLQVRASDGYDWGEVAVISAGVSDPGFGALGFGIGSSVAAIGTLGSVATSVVIPVSEAFSLQALVHPNNPADALQYEFRLTGAAGVQNSYLVSGTTVLTAQSGGNVDYTTLALNSYMHAGATAGATDLWSVRIQDGSGWTDWTDFSVTTVANSAATLPVDFSSQGALLPIKLDGGTYTEWVGQRDQADGYGFTVNAAGTLTLDFSAMDNSLTVTLARHEGMNWTNIASYGSAVGQSVSENITALGGAVTEFFRSGDSVDYALTAGEYRIVVSPGYASSATPLASNGNTLYHMAVSYQ